MHVALLFPPSVDPRAPHLAIPSLAASLKSYGARVTVRDLNLEGLLWATKEAQLIESERAVRARLATASDDERPRLRQILARTPFVVEEAELAVATLRDDEAFYDPDRYNEARNTLRYALALVSAASGRVNYGFSNAVYEVQGCNSALLRDLNQVTADPEANIFLPFWEQSLFPQLDSDRPDFVGISILNGQQIISGLMLARSLRQRGHIVLIGGTVYTKFVPQLLQRPDFFRLFCNGLVPYEGEPALRAIVLEGAWEGDPAGIPNLMRLDAKGRPVLGPARVADVDSLPVPDFTDLPLSDYLAPRPVLPILTGKGCYFNRCKFCDIPHINSISTKAYRVRRPETVAADVAALHAAHGARHFVITDETLSPALLLAIADAMEERADLKGVEPRFVGYARFEKGFTREASERLYQAGVRKLFFGLESASQTTLNHMDKGVSLDVVRRVLRDCVNSGMAVHIFSMIGFPQENEVSARQTLEFFLEHAPFLRHARHSFDIHRFGLDLRTDYFDNAASYGAMIDYDALGKLDFPISVRDWTNRDGLSNSDVEQLLEEFEAVLHNEYLGTRLYPDQHWPGFEEYAVLYGDHYNTRPFVHRTALPTEVDADRFRLEWARSARFGDPAEDLRTAWGVAGEVTLGSAAFAALTPLPEAMTVCELLPTLGRRLEHLPEEREDLHAELRQVIDALLAERLLWFRPDGKTANGNGVKESALEPATRRVQAAVVPLRLRRDVELKIEYSDRTPFGSPVGLRPLENARRVFAPVLEHASTHGVRATIRNGPKLLAEVTTTRAFTEIMAGPNGLRQEVLYPDPSAAIPSKLWLSCPATGKEITLDVAPDDWIVWTNLLGGLAQTDRHFEPNGAERAFFEELERHGLLEPAGVEGDSFGPGAEVTFVGHNTVVLRSEGTAIIVDPFFVPAADLSSSYQPLGRAQLGAIDAVLVTHSHPDHFDPISLLQFGRETLVIVPRVERESLLTVDMARRCRELGLLNVVELAWNESRRVGSFEIVALPFFGEQPSSGAVLHPRVRNHGNTYLAKGSALAAALVADAGRDQAGDIRQMAKACRAQYGPIDILFAGYRGWTTYPVQLAFSSVPQYLLFVPAEEWGVRQQLMNNADDALDLAEAWGASTIVPYGAGGAPWYWERGLGPRLDGSGVEDPSFDPFPERVVEAASRRLWVDGNWMNSPVAVSVLRPGDGLRDVRGVPELVRVAGHTWPW